MEQTVLTLTLIILTLSLISIVYAQPQHYLPPKPLGEAIPNPMYTALANSDESALTNNDAIIAIIVIFVLIACFVVYRLDSRNFPQE
jgi:hypothetical protein